MSNETYNVIMCLLALLTFIVLFTDKIKNSSLGLQILTTILN